MTLAEFASCIDGWNSVHGGPAKPEPPSEEEFEQMLRDADEADERVKRA